MRGKTSDKSLVELCRFDQLKLDDAEKIVDCLGFLDFASLASLAAACGGGVRVLVRCHSFRFMVPADQAADAIAALRGPYEVRDVSILADDFPELERSLAKLKRRG